MQSRCVLSPVELWRSIVQTEPGPVKLALLLSRNTLVWQLVFLLALMCGCAERIYCLDGFDVKY